MIVFPCLAGAGPVSGLVFWSTDRPCIVLSSKQLAVIREEVNLVYGNDFRYLGIVHSNFSGTTDEFVRDVMILAGEAGFNYKGKAGISPSGMWRDACIKAESYLNKKYPSMDFSEDEMRIFYSENTAGYTLTDRVYLRHILVHERKLVFRIILEIITGKEFSVLAQEYSRDLATASIGGDLGWLTREDLPRSFENIAFSLTPGAYYGPVSSRYGFHLIQLVSRQDGNALSFTEARETVINELVVETLNQEIARLRKKYDPRFL